MISTYSDKKKSIGLINTLAFLMIITQQISNFLPPNLNIIISGTLSLILIFMCFKQNNYTFINIPFVVWWYGFILVCLISITYSLSPSNSIGRLLSVLFSFLILGALSQYIKNGVDLKRILNYYVIGGLLFVACSFVFHFNSILYGNLADVKFGMIFSYISFQTLCIMIWKYVYARKYRVYYALSILFLLTIILISGNKKAIILPFVFATVMLFIKYRNKLVKLLFSLILFLTLTLLIFYLVMHNDLLYSALGERLEGFINLFTDQGQVDNSTLTRMSLIDKSKDVFLNNPFFGVGLDGFRELNINHTYAHNNFLEILSSLGLVGFIAYYWIYVYLLFTLFKLSKKDTSSIAVLLFSLVFTLLINDLGSISYYRISLTLMICVSISYVSVSKVQNA